ncbi:hypothetical protein [Ornithinibacillus halotolerans]|nr:hypothetical protein [Ornithinibacillus halotolerans]
MIFIIILLSLVIIYILYKLSTISRQVELITKKLLIGLKYL